MQGCARIPRIGCKSVKEEEEEAVRVLVEAGADVNLANKAGWTSLHLAASEGQVEAMRVLVELGAADVNLADTDGDTALDAAASAGHVEVMRVLVEAW
jgi:ankyrin repeat protein